MAKVWVTYAWDDNATGDVDFIAQELKSTGLTVKLDRWNLQAGIPLWDQIETHITDPTFSDAWILYATQNSLGSAACREEYRYALDRALHSRGQEYPVIALFPSPVDRSLIPAGIRVRLFVSSTDPDWKERIKAAAEGRTPSVLSPEISPYELRIHEQGNGTKRYVVEVRPRAGTWSPFIAMIPSEEKETVKPRILHGPRGRLPFGGFLTSSGNGQTGDGKWYFMFAGNEATPTQSYFVFCEEMPSVLAFGMDGGPQFKVILGEKRPAI